MASQIKKNTRGKEEECRSSGLPRVQTYMRFFRLFFLEGDAVAERAVHQARLRRKLCSRFHGRMDILLLQHGQQKGCGKRISGSQGIHRIHQLRLLGVILLSVIDQDVYKRQLLSTAGDAEQSTEVDRGGQRS